MDGKGNKKKCSEKGSEQLLLCRIIPPPYNFQCKCLQQKCVKCVKINTLICSTNPLSNKKDKLSDPHWTSCFIFFYKIIKINEN